MKRKADLDLTDNQLRELAKGFRNITFRAWWDTGGAPWTTEETYVLGLIAAVLTQLDKPPSAATLRKLAQTAAFAEQHHKTYKRKRT